AGENIPLRRRARDGAVSGLAGGAGHDPPLGHRHKPVKRLFVAVDVDESTRAEIAALSTTLEDQVAATLNRTRITWVHTDRLDLRGIAEAKAAAGPCSIDRVTLYESHLSPKGPTYTQVAQGLFAPCT